MSYATAILARRKAVCGLPQFVQQALQAATRAQPITVHRTPGKRANGQTE
ncbi:MAG: hypothetical protein P8Z73_09375 [Desulfobacteraceae bacterium]